jgi:protocatechuate 3,4-dioxygenase beta subunit
VVVAADGKSPVPKQTVRLVPQADPDGAVDAQRRLEAGTDGEGRFTFERVPEGAYAIGVVVRGEELLAQQDLVLRAARDAQIKLVLKTYQAFRGRLVDPDGLPVAGREVTLQGRYETEDGGTTSRGYTVNTDPNGEFRVVMPAIKRVSLGARVEGVGWCSRPNVDLGQLGYNLGDVKLRRGGKLSAVVRNKETGEPVGGTQVSLYPQSSDAQLAGMNLQSDSGADGRISFDALPPGMYGASAYKNGFIGASQSEVSLTADRDLPEVVLELEPAVRLAGVVLVGPQRQPAKGAKVSLGNSGSSAKADDKGKFEFAAVRKQTHQVTARLAPYLPETRTIEVTQDTADVEIVLAKEGLRIRGRLTGEDGKPLPGAYAAAVEPSVFRNYFEWRIRSDTFEKLGQWPWDQADYASAQADDQGNFEITGLAPGSYHVCGLSPGLPISHQPDVLVANGAQPPSVELSVGWRQPLLVRGRLTDPQGKPVSKRQVQLRLQSASRGSYSTSARTGEDGTYWCRAQNPGTYSVRVTAGDLGSVEREGIELSADKGTDPVDLQLSPPRFTEADYGSIAGVVHLPDGKTPAEYAVVFPVREGDDWEQANSVSQNGERKYQSRTANAAPVGADGSFRIADLPPGTYGVCAVPWRPDDWQSQPPTQALAETIPATAGGIQLQTRQNVAGVKVTLGKAGTIKGVVKAAEAGTPLPNAWISAYPQGSQRANDPYLGSFGRNVQTRSAADGTFVLPSLAEGTYSVSVSATERKPFSKPSVAVKPGEVGEELVCELEQQFYGSIEGVVLQPDGKLPAAGAKVYIGSPNQYFQDPTASTDGQGKFRVDRQAEGEQSLIVTYPGAAPAILAEVKIERDKATLVEARLQVGGSVAGTAKGEDGKPLGGDAYVVLCAQGDPNRWFDPNNLDRFPGMLAGKVGADGKYVVPYVPAGKYSASVWKNRQVVGANESVEVTDQKPTTLDFALTVPKGIIRGKVSGADGKPLGQAQVIAMPASPRMQRMAVGMPGGQAEAKDGAYSIENLVPGEYWLMCMVASGGRDMGELMTGIRSKEKVTVTDDAPVEGVDFALGEGGTVTGTVVDKDGKPIAGARVMTMPIEDYATFGSAPSGREPPLYYGMAMTDKDGRFSLSGIPFGKYTFSAMGEQYLPANSKELTVAEGQTTPEVKIELGKGDMEKWLQERQKEAQQQVEKR